MLTSFCRAGLFVAAMACTSVANAGTIEDARKAWTTGDKERAIDLYKPLALQGVPEAQFLIGGLRMAYGQRDGNQQLYSDGKALLEQAANQGHGEAASFLCQTFYSKKDTRNRLSPNTLRKYCDLAASDIGKALPALYTDPKYALKSAVEAASIHLESGQNLMAASCLGAYLRGYEKFSSKDRANKALKQKYEYASGALRKIFIQRVLRGGFRGGQADKFGPIGTEPIPPCGLSATVVGLMAGTDMLKHGLK